MNLVALHAVRQNGVEYPWSCKPKFKVLPAFSNLGGAPVLRTLWDRFDLSLLLSQAGIFKVRGGATWLLDFVYVVVNEPQVPPNH